MSFSGVPVSSFGDTVHFTREEAERALGNIAIQSGEGARNG